MEPPTDELRALRMENTAPDHTSDSDDDFEYDGDEGEVSEVELGFVSKISQPLDAKLLHASSDWGAWDGGLVGGRPQWLSPASVPATERLSCGECGTPLSFLVQIYCPLDEQTDAFHRSLYVFCCRKPGCSKQGSGKAFRMQLPQANVFYPPTDGVADFVSKETTPALCALCGQRASVKCSACKVAQYCCKDHQKDHWAHGHKEDCAACLETNSLVESNASRETLREKGSKWLFPQYELEIETEPDVGVAANEHEAKLIAAFEKRTQDAANGVPPSPADAENDPFADDADFTVSQKDLNEALGADADQDKQYVRFLTRVELAKDQVLRYARWHDQSVLWVHDKTTLASDDVPHCERCGGKRKFEFQVLPQLLFYLHVDQSSSLSQISEKSCEWGTLVVYTCSESCALDGQAADEFVHFQAPYAGAQ